jgi:cytochrome c biogenesis protein CcdA
MSRRQARTMSGPDLLKPRHTEREMTSGNVPLSPVIRAGYMVLGVMFLGATCGVAAAAISSVVRESWWIKFLVGVVIAGWFLLFFAFGRGW